MSVLQNCFCLNSLDVSVSYASVLQPKTYDLSPVFLNSGSSEGAESLCGE